FSCLYYLLSLRVVLFFFSSRRRHTRFSRDWSSDVCSSDLDAGQQEADRHGPEVIAGGHAGTGGEDDVARAEEQREGHETQGKQEIGRASCRERGRAGGGADH